MIICKRTFFFDGFLLLFLIDMLLSPLLAALGLGMGLIDNPNYYMRYIYLITFAWVLAFHIILNKNVKFNIVSVAFAILMPIGMILGLIQGNFGKEFIVHIYTVIMPIFAMSFGWYFIEVYLLEPKIQLKMKRIFYMTLFTGIVATFIFRLGYVSGNAVYNAVGMWNYTMAMPYFLVTEAKVLFSALGLLGTIVAGKRIGILVVIVYFLIYIILLKGNIIKKFKIILTIALLSIVIIPVLLDADILNRIIYTFTQLFVEGDLESASAGRTSEIIAVFSYISQYFGNFIFGSGFGSKVMVFEGFYRHYSHFTPLSYLLIGGVLLPLIVYLFFIKTGIMLLNKVNKKTLPKESWFFVLIFWGILISSLTGAVLFNYTTLWIFIGCAWRLNTDSMNAKICT
ncbi:MAG: hypothetical protein KO464_06920 [Candidatus Methanofastidiosum sp.]|nr:hypothetical protein [Methanofastidiosum sp.]